MGAAKKAKKAGKKKAVKKKVGKKKAAKKKVTKKKKKKAPKLSARTAMRRVWAGKLNRTNGGLTKADLCKNKAGKVVSKKSQQHNKKGGAGKWIAALMRARKELKLKGFVAC